MAGTAAQSAAAEDRSSASIGSEICTGRLPSLNSMHGRRPLSRCVSSHEQQWPGGSSKGSGLCTTLHAQCAERLPGLIRAGQLALSCLKQQLIEAAA